MRTWAKIFISLITVWGGVWTYVLAAEGMYFWAAFEGLAVAAIVGLVVRAERRREAP